MTMSYPPQKVTQKNAERSMYRPVRNNMARGCVYGMVYNGSACTFRHCSIATFYIVPNNDCPAPRRQPTLFGQASLEFEAGGRGGPSFFLGMADMLTQRPPFRFGSRVFSD